ncbi:hypothetical protein DFH06DRAFT_1151603 [Mycena polygramma]|nr:hypothetical protein DFH06DRAFT_1151603 [Mycena polygramma]
MLSKTFNSGSIRLESVPITAVFIDGSNHTRYMTGGQGLIVLEMRDPRSHAGRTFSHSRVDLKEVGKNLSVQIVEISKAPTKNTYEDGEGLNRVYFGERQPGTSLVDAFSINLSKLVAEGHTAYELAQSHCIPLGRLLNQSARDFPPHSLPGVDCADDCSAYAWILGQSLSLRCFRNPDMDIIPRLRRWVRFSLVPWFAEGYKGGRQFIWYSCSTEYSAAQLRHSFSAGYHMYGEEMEQGRTVRSDEHAGKIRASMEHNVANVAVVALSLIPDVGTVWH